MTKLMWNAAGERLFEAGVDRGVLYVSGSAGVPWNGLISVSESPAGGAVTPRYIDGVKYMNRVSKEEFHATIEAYTYPDEFAQCDGTIAVANGLFVTRQKRKPFGLSYRTMVGNDLEGVGHAYKIHLIYNATAAPSSRPNNTLSDTVDPFNFSWEIFTMPPAFAGYRQTAHFVIDSREVPSDLLKDIEDILYGTESADPRLPSATELIFLFETYESGTFDAGFLTETYFNGFDAGHISEAQTSTIDGGSL